LFLTKETKTNEKLTNGRHKMKITMKGLFKGYRKSCFIAGSCVLGWNIEIIRIENNIRDRSDPKIETPTFTKQMWRLGRDLTLAMIWPIMAPFAVKSYIEETTYNPIDLLDYKKDECSYKNIKRS
jgi:hypothetical protein